MNRFFFEHMFLAGLVPLLVVHGLLRLAVRFPKARRGLHLLAAALAFPPLAFYGSTLVMLPPWASVPWLVIAPGVLWLARRRGSDHVHAALWLAAYTVLHTASGTWAFWLLAPGCERVVAVPGTARLDRGAPFDSATGLFGSLGAYSVDVDPEERYAFVSFAHGASLRAVARLPLRDGGAAETVRIGAGGILHARYDPSTRKVYAIDHTARRLFVLGGEPFRLASTIDVDSQEPMDVSFDEPSGRLFVIDRTEIPEAPDPADRSAGVLVLDLARPTLRTARIPLEVLPGANEFIAVPGERRAFITSEGFITLHAFDFANLTTTKIYTGVPGIGGGAVDMKRRELYITHTIGLVQVRDIDDFHYKRTLLVRGARAVAIDPAKDALYVSDFFKGRVKRIDPDTGAVRGEIDVGLRMRQMKVLRDGRLLTASACGVLVAPPP